MGDVLARNGFQCDSGIDYGVPIAEPVRGLGVCVAASFLERIGWLNLYLKG